MGKGARDEGRVLAFASERSKRRDLINETASSNPVLLAEAFGNEEVLAGCHPAGGNAAAQELMPQMLRSRLSEPQHDNVKNCHPAL